MRISDWSSDVCSSDLRLRGDRRAQKFAVLGGDVQRVLAQDRDHLEAERDAQVLEDAADLRLADLVVGLVVEVHLVDGAAGGDDEKLVHIVYLLTDPVGAHSGATGTSPQELSRPSSLLRHSTCRSARAGRACIPQRCRHATATSPLTTTRSE